MNKRIIALICVLIAFLNTSDIKARVIRESLGEVTISAYSPYCNTPAGTRNTATGERATARHTIAVDANNPIVPVGSKVEIDGIIYTVEDRGGFGKYGRDFDIFMDTDEEADRWGVRRRFPPGTAAVAAALAHCRPAGGHRAGVHGRRAAYL